MNLNGKQQSLRNRVSRRGKRGEEQEGAEEIDNKNNNHNYRYYDRLQYSIQEAKKASDLVIVSSHVGPHFRENPSPQYVNFAHMIIDMGADIYWGHSNHMP
jgi:poly-gamma-glutamate capsule biosynthesis protein CapA/YwtB (metallophosphatase superfamily)